MYYNLLFLSFCSFVKVIRSRKKPLPTQVEDVDLLALLVQTLGFWVWVAVFYGCAFVGNEPIHVTPIQVNK